MSLEQYLELLKNKFKYNDDLLNVLRKIIPALILYYGEDKKELILSAIEDTEIHIQSENEDMYNYLKNYFKVKKNWNISLNAAGFFETEYTLSGKTLSSNSLIYFIQNHYGTYNPIDYSDNTFIINLIHELCHLVKTYGRIDLIDGRFQVESGISKEYYKYNASNGLLVLYENEHVGLEEALNTIDEENIMNLINLDYDRHSGYNEMANVLKRLLDNDEIKDIFKQSQFESDIWIDYFKEDSSKLSKLFDEWLILIYTPIDIRIMDDKYQDKIDDIKNKINNLINKYNKSNLMI